MHCMFMPAKLVYVAPPTASSTRVLGCRALSTAIASLTTAASDENCRPVPVRLSEPFAYLQSGCAKPTMSTWT